MRCAIAQDLNRHLHRQDAAEAREEADDAVWPQLRDECIEKLMLRQGLTAERRCLLSWDDMLGQAVVTARIDDAMAACVEDQAEGGRLLELALREAAGRLVDSVKTDLLEEYWRGQREFDEEAA